MDGKLFQFEDEQVVNEGPVTCLGVTFENDEKRREFFRDELRKKLPELRLIEGFPIGTDDDIIALSDPPYYTACPNPWINDFIKQWEAEKVQLQAEGKRRADFEVKEPYAADVSEGKNNPIYMAHAYHTKVPHPAIMKYILHYTQPGDTVFDGFCGTGMTGVASNLCGSPSEVSLVGGKKGNIGVRKCICSDLSPIASLISASYNLAYDSKEFERQANSILKLADDRLGWMYKTNVNGKECSINYTIWSDVFLCPNCGSDIVFWDAAVDLENEVIKDEIVCPCCGARHTKKTLSKALETQYDSLIHEPVSKAKKVPVRVNYTDQYGKRGEKPIDSIDKEIFFKSINHDECKYLGEIPNGDESSRNYSLGIKHIHQLFTSRNLRYLSYIHSLVNSNPILHAWFTSTIQNASIMYKFRMDRKGGLVSGTLFVPSLNIEQNPAKLLKSKIKDFVQSAHQYRNNSAIGICSATDLSNINANSVDYMFIDPPFGANLMYSELNSIWEGWLDVTTNTKEEAIVNNSQGKNLFDYQNLMNRSLKEFYRILKPGHWITIEFSNTSASVWNSIQNALQGVGFIVANVAALDKKQGSFKAVTTTTAVKEDLVITCYKPSSSFIKKIENSADTRSNVWDFVEDLLEHLPVHLKKDNATTAVIERSPKILFDRLIAYYVQHGYPVPIDASAFQKGLKERFVERDGMFFTAEQAIEYEEKKKEAPTFVGLFILVSSEAEGIEWLKRKLEDGPKTYSEILPDWMQDLVKPKKGDTLPELMQILDENFLKDENGYWRIPDVNKATELEAVRNKRRLKEFEIYVEARKIKDARLEALRAGFKECYKNKDFATIVAVGNKLPEELLTTDEVLLRFYDIASSRV